MPPSLQNLSTNDTAILIAFLIDWAVAAEDSNGYVDIDCVHFSEQITAIEPLSPIEQLMLARELLDQLILLTPETQTASLAA